MAARSAVVARRIRVRRARGSPMQRARYLRVDTSTIPGCQTTPPPPRSFAMSACLPTARRSGGDRSPRRVRACSSSNCSTPLATAPIELTRVGKWIERVETLRLDGERPTSKALAARLASFWLPSQTVLYIGATDASVGRRVASIGATELGDRRPNAAGHWLKTLRSLDDVKVWWSLTSATEEYEDALLAAFADGVPDGRTRWPSPTRRSCCRSPTCVGRPANGGRPG